MWPQHGVNLHCDVFGGGVDIGELGYIQVEVLVVEVIEHMLLDGGGQHAKVDDIANLWIHRATDAHDEFVVVAGGAVVADDRPAVCVGERCCAVPAGQRAEVAAGRQAYIVCPLIEESEKLEVASAEETIARLAFDELKGLRLALLHGRMSSAEKESVMEAFRTGETDEAAV